MKIALTAMSGIRAYDQELLELGLTLPGFVERSKVIASLPSLGLLTLAGMTPSHHELEYIEVPDIENKSAIVDRLKDFDLVAISSFSAQIKEAYELGNALLQHDVAVVLGGLHTTALPDEAKQHCTSVVVGEGELTWQQLLKDAETKKLDPIYGNREQEFDLNDAPMPAFELLNIDNYNRLTVQTSRGCPHFCEFCANTIMLTRKYKQKPQAKVLAEIDKIREIWPHPFIEFADDNTFVNKDYWKALLPELKKRKIRWFTETDISIANDTELLHLMRESGCAQVLIGLESPTSGSLRGLDTRSNWKEKQFPKYMQAIKTIQSQGISVNGCFILGLDGQDTSVFDKVYDFVEKSGLHEVQITVQTAFPGTLLYERLVNEKRIIELGAWEKCTLFDINFIPKNMTVQKLGKEFRELGVKLYNKDFTRKRQDHFKELLRELVRSRHSN